MLLNENYCLMILLVQTYLEDAHISKRDFQQVAQPLILQLYFKGINNDSRNTLLKLIRSLLNILDAFEIENYQLIKRTVLNIILKIKDV